jgi:hypothetical protein
MHSPDANRAGDARVGRNVRNNHQKLKDSLC